MKEHHMIHYIKLEAHEDTYPADWTHARVEEAIVLSYRHRRSDILEWHEQLGLPFRCRVTVLSQSLVVKPILSSWFEYEAGFEFEDAGHAMLFKLTFGGDL